MMRDDTDVLIEISRWQRKVGAPVVFDPKPPATLNPPRKSGWQPLVAPIYNHGDLAYEVAKLREWERLTGVKTPLQIEETVKAWEWTQ